MSIEYLEENGNKKTYIVRRLKKKEMNYIYDTVQVPPNIDIGQKEKSNEAEAYLREIINSKAKDNWEFDSVKSIATPTSPGCLASLLGKKVEYYTTYVIVFRREVA